MWFGSPGAPGHPFWVISRSSHFQEGNRELGVRSATNFTLRKMWPDGLNLESEQDSIGMDGSRGQGSEGLGVQAPPWGSRLRPGCPPPRALSLLAFLRGQGAPSFRLTYLNVPVYCNRLHWNPSPPVPKHGPRVRLRPLPAPSRPQPVHPEQPARVSRTVCLFSDPSRLLPGTSTRLAPEGPGPGPACPCGACGPGQVGSLGPSGLPVLVLRSGHLKGLDRASWPQAALPPPQPANEGGEQIKSSQAPWGPEEPGEPVDLTPDPASSPRASLRKLRHGVVTQGALSDGLSGPKDPHLGGRFWASRLPLSLCSTRREPLPAGGSAGRRGAGWAGAWRMDAEPVAEPPGGAGPPGAGPARSPPAAREPPGPRVRGAARGRAPGPGDAALVRQPCPPGRPAATAPWTSRPSRPWSGRWPSPASWTRRC